MHFPIIPATTESCGYCRQLWVTTGYRFGRTPKRGVARSIRAEGANCLIDELLSGSSMRQLLLMSLALQLISVRRSSLQWRYRAYNAKQQESTAINRTIGVKKDGVL